MNRDILLKLLSFEAKRVLKKHSPQIVAISGSSGKSSTRDAVYEVLSISGRVRKSGRIDDSFAPLCTILGIPHPGRNVFKWLALLAEGFFIPWSKKDYPRFLVLEVSALGPNSIRSLAEWLRPHVTVIASFGDVPPHIEYFDSLESLRDEKATLVASTRENGIVVLNQDDGSVAHFGKSARVPVKTFGLVLADVSAKNPHTEKDEAGRIRRTSFEIVSENHSARVSLSDCLGTIQSYPVVAAFVVGMHFGIPFEKISEAFTHYMTPLGRMHLVSGIKDTMIIDDSSGSNPASLSESLRTLKEITHTNGRKIVVLGDMLDLGKHAAHAHTEAGKQASFADIVITVGFRSRLIAEGALQAGVRELSVFQADSSEEAGKILQQILKPNDIVLIKGDKSLRMVDIVEEVMRYPERASEFLERK